MYGIWDLDKGEWFGPAMSYDNCIVYAGRNLFKIKGHVTQGEMLVLRLLSENYFDILQRKEADAD